MTDIAPFRMAAADRQTITIGPFALDRVRRVLTCRDQPVAMSATLFDVLLYLADHPDRVVTKGELLDAVWPNKIVEEANVSQTVFALRKALAASGATESVIVTAPGKGYRLGLPVSAPPTVSQPVPVRRASRLPQMLAALVCAGLGLGWLGLWHPWAKRPPDHQARVVVGAFEDLTQGVRLNRALALATAIDLRQAPDLDVLGHDRIAETLALMTRPADTPLDPAVAREVCMRNNGQVAVSGAVTQIGGRYLVSLAAENCATGALLATQKAEVDRRDALLSALDRLVDAVRAGLGEDAASIRAYAVPLQARQTASLEALEAYSEAVDAVRHGGRVESVALFRHALALDPHFVMAWVDLAAQYLNLGDRALAADAAARAYALRDYAGPLDRLQLTIRYQETHFRNEAQTLAALQAMTRDYPGNPFGWAELANMQSWYAHYDAAIASATRAVALEPEVEGAYVVLARAQLRSGRIDDAQATCNTAINHHVDGDDLHGVLVQIAAARHDDAAVDRALVWAAGRPGQVTILVDAALYALSQGRVRASEALFAQALTARGPIGSGNVFAAPNARLYNDLGMVGLAQSQLGQVPKGYDSPDYRFVLNAIGDEAAGAALLRADLAAAPDDTLLHQVYAVEEHAASALRHGNPRAAVADLEIARPWDRHTNDVPYLRGQAMLAAGDGAGAANEFRAIIDHPGVEPLIIHAPLAWLGLARALRIEHDIPGAQQAYATFLRLWQHADPDVPVLVAARAEYAALQRAGGVRNTTR